MKKYLLGLMALLGIVVFSAFAIQHNDKHVTGDYFYKYTGPSNPGINDIKERTNYQRFELGCDDGEHVCGVYLATDGVEGAYPNVSEFNAVKNDLWTSETQGFSELPGEIVMKE